ncbi:hypothetical protein [Burkholderia anthina]|uniref:hypothetical protein n=1 Tax=Burkholderia anthina TaxID=179879 RepID=UPI001AA02F41|nr:hypothetical protein [Burkholderia anthina]QTD88232.1 hypothetical protein J4G50_10305 [Burkholderia anthina]
MKPFAESRGRADAQVAACQHADVVDGRERRRVARDARDNMPAPYRAIRFIK